MGLFPVHSTTVIQNVNKAQVKVRAKRDNVAGKLKKHINNDTVNFFFWDSSLYDRTRSD